MNAANENIPKNCVKRDPFQLDGGLIVGSKDAVCHYPSIDIDVAAEEAKIEMIEFDVEVELNTEDLALCSTCALSQYKINAEFVKCYAKRRYKNGSKPGLTVRPLWEAQK